MPCQQKVGIICERKRRYHLPKFAFPKTFINDPFSDFDVIQNNEIIPEISSPNRPIVFDEITPPQPARISPTINKILVNANPLLQEIDQITPNSITPKVLVIEKRIEPDFLQPRVQFLDPRAQTRRKLFRFSGLENPYLNYHFNNHSHSSRIKKR